MKKLFLASIALLSVLLFSACSSDESVAKRTEGTYIVRRITSVKGMTFQIVETGMELIVKAEADNFVKVVIPTTSYDLEGKNMVIPEFTIFGVPVVDDLENGTAIPKHSFLVDGKKSVKGTIEGEFNADGEVEVVVEYQYGDMPLAIEQEFDYRWKDLDYDN